MNFKFWQKRVKEPTVTEQLDKLITTNTIIHNVYIQTLRKLVQVAKDQDEVLSINVTIPLSMVDSPHLLEAIMKNVEDQLKE